MFAIAHFITTAILMKLTKLRLDKTLLLSHRELLVCAIFGGLPDIDGFFSALSFLFGGTSSVHRAFTHNLFIPIVLLIVSLIVLKLKGYDYSKLFFLAGAAYGIHLILDLLSGSMVLLFPFSLNWIGIHSTYQSYAFVSALAVVDAILFVSWIALRYYKTTIVKID